DKHTAYGRALLFGIGAAVAGLIGYAMLVVILQGWTIGYISIGVGYIVGKAMMVGSKGIGGRRYQITAALLTYAAVSMAAVPIQLALSAKHKTTQQEQAQKEQQQLEKDSGQPSSTAKENPTMGLAAALGYLALIGLASP